MQIDIESQTKFNLKRRTLEEQAVKEGQELLKKQRETTRIKKLQEQREIREMMETYWPFEKNTFIKPRGLRNLRLEGLFPNQDFLNAKRFVGTLDLGRPGGGAPIFSENGNKLTRTREDPLLRFQFGSHDLRRCVDNTLRYKTNPRAQEEYRKELDKLVEEKKRLQAKKKDEESALDGKHNPTDGKTIEKSKFHKGHRPRKLDPIFYPCKNVYTTSKPRRLSPLSNGKENGIELVPILVKQKVPIKIPLESTDITNEKKYFMSTVWNRQGSSAYLKDLTQQILNKEQKLKEMKAEDRDSVRRHFTTWDGFWGRPGHGAPRSAIKKQRLDKLLYPQMVPIGVH